MADKSAVKKPQRKYIDLMVKCPRCGNKQHEYVYSLDEKKWFKCNDCQQLSASGAWTVLYFGA